MFIGVLTAALLMAQAQAAPAPASPTTVAPAVVTSKTAITYAPPKAADQKDNQLVCRNELPMGSRIPVRRCRSVGDMRDRALQDRMQIEHAQANISMH